MAGAGLEHLIDVAAFERYVNEHVPGGSGPFEIRKHVAGFSNETFFVSRGDEHWVMRRPPNGPLLPTAHDVVREYRFISGLYGRARVPRPVLLCEDTSVMGVPFYLMERMNGTVMFDTIPSAYDTPEGRRKIAEELIAALAELHAVDWEAAGIKGRHGGYIRRQVERWSSQWELTRPRTRELPGLDAITTWLRERTPEDSASTVVHGDYNLHNVMFDSNEPKLIAIFDWEMATVGDPLSDLGYLMNGWGAGEPVPGYEDRAPVLPPLSSREGFPSKQEMADLYEAATGRSMNNFLFYRALAAYKGIVILEGLYMHYIEGAASNPGAADFEWRVPMMIANLERLISRGY